ncbi:MAG: hypothetical protein Q7I98_03435, partial [Erysipelotrichaceae bacterium]|nr:hypothetical protein [Erysipelotrichaceae bacterium]
YYFYTHEGGAQNAVRRAESVISKFNEYVSARGFIDVLKNQNESRKKAQQWALECAQQIK